MKLCVFILNYMPIESGLEASKLSTIDVLINAPSLLAIRCLFSEININMIDASDDDIESI
jgi:hypothetical protein